MYAWDKVRRRDAGVHGCMYADWEFSCTLGLGQTADT